MVQSNCLQGLRAEFILPKGNRHSTKKRVLKMSLKDVLIAAKPRNNKEATGNPVRTTPATDGKPEGEL